MPEVVYTSEGNVYLHLSGVIVAESNSGDTRYLLSDGASKDVGSVRHAADETATVITYKEFDPYGNPLPTAYSLLLTPYGFTGEWWEDDVGLLYLRARWYQPETGTFLSRDAVESEPPYQYVRGNPVNLTDPSGKFPPLPPYRGPNTTYGVAGQPTYDVCENSWPSSGHWREVCDRAYQGDREAMEMIYQYIADLEGFTYLQNASKALNHFLDGTSTPEDPLYLSWSWYLSADETVQAYRENQNKIIAHIETLEQNCQCSYPTSRHEKVENINIDPSYGILLSDIQLVLGAHTLHVNANIDLNSDCVGMITYDWYVYELYDFRKWQDNMFTIPLRGWEVPAVWADFLVDDGMAAEYWVAIQHREQKPYAPN